MPEKETVRFREYIIYRVVGTGRLLAPWHLVVYIYMITSKHKGRSVQKLTYMCLPQFCILCALRPALHDWMVSETNCNVGDQRRKILKDLYSI